MKRPFSEQTFWIWNGREKNTGFPNNITDGSVLLKYPSESWRWAGMHRTKTLKSYSAIIDRIIYKCAFPSVANVFCEKEILYITYYLNVFYFSVWDMPRL